MKPHPMGVPQISIPPSTTNKLHGRTHQIEGDLQKPVSSPCAKTLALTPHSLQAGAAARLGSLHSDSPTAGKSTQAPSESDTPEGAASQ